MADRAYLERLSRDLVAKGKLVEAGWVSLRLVAVPDSASKEQLQEMRMAFFAGAQHVFTSIMTIFDPGEEPTDADLHHLTKINAELKAFISEFELRFTPAEGSS